MITNSWDVKTASEWLGMTPNALREKAKAGKVPGFKVGKEWRFLELDLLEFVRGQYKSCHSSNAKTRRTGGSISSRPMARELESLLARTIGGKPKNTTTN